MLSINAFSFDKYRFRKTVYAECLFTFKYDIKYAYKDRLYSCYSKVSKGITYCWSKTRGKKKRMDLPAAVSLFKVTKNDISYTIMYLLIYIEFYSAYSDTLQCSFFLIHWMCSYMHDNWFDINNTDQIWL